MIHLILISIVLYNINIINGIDIDIWKKRNVNELILNYDGSIDEDKLIQFHIDKSDICLHDNIKLKYEISYNNNNYNDNEYISNGISQMINIGILMENREIFTFAQLQKLQDIEDNYKCRKNTTKNIKYNNDIKDSYILCKLNEEHCEIKVTNVLYINNSPNGGGPLLRIEFDNDTNEPYLASTSHILSSLTLTPRLIGFAVGSWTNSKTLDIIVSDLYAKEIISAHSNNKEINVSVKYLSKHIELPICNDNIEKIIPINHDSLLLADVSSSPLSSLSTLLQGEITIRPTEDGKISIFALNISSMSIIPNTSYKVNIRQCKPSYFIPNLLKDLNELDVDNNKVPIPLTRIEGLISMSGKNAIKFSQESYSDIEKGTWSMTFWIKIIESPNGNFRTLFYKGNGNDLERTPSAWLQPNSMRLSIRVSTIDNLDHVIDSNIDIPLNEWSLLSFVFKNSTNPVDAIIDQQHYYSLTSYVNDQLDVSIIFNTFVLGNEGSVSLFKDISHNGPIGFAKDIILWNTPLSHDNINNLYNKKINIEKDLDFKAVELAMNVLQGNNNNNKDIFGFKKNNKNLIDNPLDNNDNNNKLNIYNENNFEIPNEKSMEMSEIYLSQAKESLELCEPFEVRLDLYAEAARFGSLEALFAWSMMISHGFENPQVSCGYQKSSSFFSIDEEKINKNQIRAAFALSYAADRGYMLALLPLSTILLSSIGISGLSDPYSELFLNLDIPIYGNNKNRKISPLLVSISNHLQIVKKSCSNIYNIKDYSNDIKSNSDSVLCWNKVRTNSNNSSNIINNNFNNNGSSSSTDMITPLAIGFIHLAAVYGIPEAEASLSHRYQKGFGVKKDIETSAYYAKAASAYVSTEYHRIGGQSIVESDRIDDNTELEIDKGKSGNDDELIQFQKIQAEEGNIPAMLAMGDLHYFGARGLARDQIQALDYYNRAANAGNALGLCNAGAMYLKGEGADKNVTKAIELYEKGSDMGNVKAKNGLGFIYFYGKERPKNETKAFNYFLESALTETEPDSLFNCGHCLQHGIGVDKDLSRAYEFYKIAAHKFGHFDSITAIGVMKLEGIGVQRSAIEALPYLTASVNMGPWAQWNRRGLDQYLNKFHTKALMCYIHSSELGFEISQSNAAFIIRRKRNSLQLGNDNWFLNTNNNEVSIDNNKKINNIINNNEFDLLSTLKVRLLTLSSNDGNIDSLMQLGHSYYTGDGVIKNIPHAIYYYSKASAKGCKLASVYLGVMNQFGIGIDINTNRALKYYDYSLSDKIDDNKPLELQIKLMTQTLIWMITTAGSYSIMKPFTISTEYVVKMLWNI